MCYVETLARTVTPKQLSALARAVSHDRGLGLVDRFLMTCRPRICPFHVLLDHIPSGARLLDVGCGNGLWLFLLSRLGRISTGLGVEVDPAKVDIANSLKMPEDVLEFIRLGPEDDWPRDCCDGLTMIDVLHHVPMQQHGAFLSRIVSTGASRVLFKDVDPSAPIKRRMNSLHDLALSSQLPRYARQEDVVRRLEDIGFAISYIGRHDMLWYSHYVIVADKTRSAG